MRWFLFLFLPAFSYGQKTALLSQDFKKPILFTDSVTVEQVSSGYFAVEVSNFDTLYVNLKYLSNMLKTRKRSKMKYFEMKAGTTTIKTATTPKAYGDRFEIMAESNINNLTSRLKLTLMTNNNARNGKRIDQMIRYIENNKALFTNRYEIQPKVYNVVIETY